MCQIRKVYFDYFFSSLYEHGSLSQENDIYMSNGKKKEEKR
jgi:hypothetical protein